MLSILRWGPCWGNLNRLFIWTFAGSCLGYSRAFRISSRKLIWLITKTFTLWSRSLKKQCSICLDSIDCTLVSLGWSWVIMCRLRRCFIALFYVYIINSNLAVKTTRHKLTLCRLQSVTSSEALIHRIWILGRLALQACIRSLRDTDFRDFANSGYKSNMILIENCNQL